MPTIQATAQTVIRDATGSAPINIKPGQKLAVFQVFPATGQMLEIVLGGNAGTLKQGDRRSIYAPHWQLPLPWGKPIAPKGVKLRVPYYAQCDTLETGWRYCFSHSCAMMASYLLGDRYPGKNLGQPEQYYIDIVERFGDTTDSSVQVAALAELGIEAYFSQSISPKDMYKALGLNIPIPVGVAYKSSGHWICLVGHENNNWLVHDPYGSRSGSSNYYPVTSTDQGREGAYDSYSAEVMDQVYFDQRQNSDRECGWAIVPVKVQGKPTGLDWGM